MHWLRKPLRKWLGIEADLKAIQRRFEALERQVARRIEDNRELFRNVVDIGVDLHTIRPEETTIWVMSRLGEGHVMPVRAHCGNAKELMALVADLKSRYHTERLYVDAIPAEARCFKEWCG